jgi:hypothetical protein
MAAWFGDQQLHEYCLTVATVAAAGFIAAAIHEVWRNVFGPTISLPRRTVVRFIVLDQGSLTGRIDRAM